MSVADRGRGPAWHEEMTNLARRLPLESDSAFILAEQFLALTEPGGERGSAETWIVMEGPTAAGKDTQLRLLAEALRRARWRVAEVDGRGGGTVAGDLLSDALFHNRRQQHARRWHADYLLKSAAWIAMRRSNAFPAADLVLCNRGPLSQLAYSAVSMRDLEILERLGPGVATLYGPEDVVVLLTCPVEVLIDRARRRSARGEKPARVVDSSRYIRAVGHAFLRLLDLLPAMHVIAADAAPDSVRRAVHRVASEALVDPFERRRQAGQDTLSTQDLEGLEQG